LVAVSVEKAPGVLAPGATIRRCPCCGGEIEARRHPTIVAAEVQLGRVAQRIVDHLAAHFGLWVSNEKLVFAVYGNDIDGGPLDAVNTIHSILWQIRQRLKDAGLAIDGRRSGGFRMRWLNEAAE
jgi:DNA-binding response OmpR family regulator